MDPPVGQSRPTDGQGPPDVPPRATPEHWYGRNWVVGAIALFLGAGIGAAASLGSATPRAVTVTTPAKTVVQTVAGPTKFRTRTTTVVHLRNVPGPTRTVTDRSGDNISCTCI